jgi:antitoxin component YwqK of YwqJK toxin-antitoxin module
MKFFLIIFISLLTSLTAFGQVPEYHDSGFTNKAEAKNLTVNGLMEGKWIEYTNNTNDNFTNDTNSLYYRLSVYKDNKPIGVQRGYYKSGKLYYLLYYVPNPLGTGWPDIQKKYYRMEN